MTFGNKLVKTSVRKQVAEHIFTVQLAWHSTVLSFTSSPVSAFSQMRKREKMHNNTLILLETSVGKCHICYHGVL